VSPDLLAAACRTRCALEACVGSGCWLAATRVGPVIEAVMRGLIADAARHVLECLDVDCLHFAHLDAPAGRRGGRAA
jgi:hypothetical protein